MGSLLNKTRGCRSEGVVSGGLRRRGERSVYGGRTHRTSFLGKREREAAKIKVHRDFPARSRYTRPGTDVNEQGRQTAVRKASRAGGRCRGPATSGRRP